MILISLSFDDCHMGQYSKVMPILSKAGMVATLYNSPIHIGAVDGSYPRMTITEVKALYDAGWDMGIQQYGDTLDVPINTPGTNQLTTDGVGTYTWINGSSRPHYLSVGNTVTIKGSQEPEFNGVCIVNTTPNEYTFTFSGSATSNLTAHGQISCERLDKTQREWINDIQSVQHYYTSNGMSRGLDHIAYTNGVYNLEYLNTVRNLGIKTGRTTSIGTAPTARMFDGRMTDPMSLLSLPVTYSFDQGTASSALGYVDLAEANQCHCLIYGHAILDGVGVGTSQASDTTEWQKFIFGDGATGLVGLWERQQTGRVRVVSISDMYRNLKSSFRKVS